MRQAPAKQTFVEHIPVVLTPEEIMFKGRELARLGTQVVAKKAAQKSAVAAYKAEIEELEEEQGSLIRQLNTGTEERPIECFERPRYQDLIVEIVRADTGEVWTRRPMHPSERQLAISSGDVDLSEPSEVTRALSRHSKKKKPGPDEESSDNAQH